MSYYVLPENFVFINNVKILGMNKNVDKMVFQVSKSNHTHMTSAELPKTCSFIKLMIWRAFRKISKGIHG